MPETTTNASLKRVKSRYKLVILNDDTFEEIIKFRLSRLSVYMIFSSVFLLMISLAIALLVLTPLKYYIPGSGVNSETRRQLQMLKIRTDSLEQTLKYKNAYLEGLKKAFGPEIMKDTATIKAPQTPDE